VDTRPWYRRALPVTAIAVGLVAILALVLPGVRHQLALSATHVPQEYVALSFERTTAGTVATCARSGNDVRVSFVVDSALQETRTLDYVVEVGAAKRTGKVVVEPGETAVVTQVVARLSKARYDVSVLLPDVDRRIIAHCSGVTR